jgi:hypothetical protein
MRSLRWVVLGALAVLVTHAVWSRTGRDVPSGPQEPYGVEVFVGGKNQGAGNLLGVQPYMVPADYASAERFRAKLESYLAVAEAKGFLNARTVAVFPEYVGTWLVALDEKAGVYEAPDIRAALRLVALTRPLAFARSFLTTAERDRTKAGLFRMKAAAMAAAYQDAFSRLARGRRITIVAGSIVLPEPRVEQGRLVAGEGPLRNVSAVFGPDGRIDDRLVRKAFLIEAEKPFLAACPVGDLPVFETPAGRLGVLICDDSWYPEAYRVLREKRVDLLAVPSYAAADDCWGRPWAGYDGAPAPPDVDPADVSRLTEGQAWTRYALSGRLASSGARAGVNVFLRGALWDLGDDGRSLAVVATDAAHPTEGSRRDGAALVAEWLTEAPPEEASARP